MNPEYCRRLARQCRDLMFRTRSEAAREQLRLWIEEFEARAALLEDAVNPVSQPRANTC